MYHPDEELVRRSECAPCQYNRRTKTSHPLVWARNAIGSDRAATPQIAPGRSTRRWPSGPTPRPNPAGPTASNAPTQVSKLRFRPWRGWLTTVAALGVGGFLNIELPLGLYDRALAATWRTTGDALIARALNALKERIKAADAKQADAQALHDALAARLEALKRRKVTLVSRTERDLARLEQASGRAETAGDSDLSSGSSDPGRAEPSSMRSTLCGAAASVLPRYLEACRELARLEAALTDLALILDRADLRLAHARARLETRVSELSMLQAAAECRVLDLTLMGIDDPFAGSERLDRATLLLGCGSPTPHTP